MPTFKDEKGNNIEQFDIEDIFRYEDFLKALILSHKGLIGKIALQHLKETMQKIYVVPAGN